jgi:hypothetical protein
MFLLLSHLTLLLTLPALLPMYLAKHPALLQNFPLCPPADVAIRLVPGAVPQPIYHLLLDVTILSTPPIPPSSLYPILLSRTILF